MKPEEKELKFNPMGLESMLSDHLARQVTIDKQFRKFLQYIHKNGRIQTRHKIEEYLLKLLEPKHEK